MASISLRSVQKAYGDHAPVIRDVDLEIGEHEFCVFLGPSGCGKSTLLRMIAGLEDITDGDLYIGAKLVNDVPAAQRGVAMVFQSYALFPHMTVYENMAFGLTLAKTPKDEIDRKVREAARVLQLEALLERRPKALSGGQRQRVAIGRAIVRSPGVFLFDEPLSNLDATLRGQTRVEIARLHRQFEKASVVYVTHDQIEAMTLADKIVLLHAGADTAKHGSIAQVGTPLELYHRPKSRFVAGFIGSPRMNFLPARVVSATDAGVRIRLDGTDEPIDTDVCGAGLQPDQPVTLGIRPEHLDPAVAPARQHITRTVSLVEQLGEHSYLHLDQPGGTVLIAKAPGDRTPRQGDAVAFNVPRASCHLFTEDGFAVASASVAQFA
ncbi:Maltose/maltodextrin transport ATP-binding protein MalK [Caballeronia glathei]|jgi:multiple sugar transport system ATP-binding protein|uniref:ABC transporter n=1 Tax=Caballeronia glathei TaxID=60547 RepID=A0A069PM81_9BURK|nr:MULTISPECIES: sn-glycerol-3-phosphate ABC transporter ATP-binding protein UgpC [Burkholderiaceae]KDR41690.1 ABC transporter [Caballeronia glathei]TCK36378.1 carbohydrate ABC transporter ATP-binding protein (CUT1 family) [Paraburkholderia sp. BL8N3]CDY78167.1 Maltose/maltodextrin transport ATP-binding protein MalK [Caballeronia glathei]